MQYKEEHFDSAGAKAIAKALTKGNDNVTKSRKQKAEAGGKKPAAKKPAARKGKK